MMSSTSRILGKLRRITLKRERASITESNKPLDYHADENSGQYREWTDRMEALGRDLYVLAVSTEQEFLSAGEKLNDFYVRSMDISKTSASVLDALSPEKLEAITNRFQDLLDRIGNYLGKSEIEFDESTKVLNDLFAVAGKIRKPIAGFKKIVKTLEILSISTKIESAQLGREGEDFVTIADDVEKLSVLIGSSFADILARADSLSSSVEQTLSKVAGLRAKQKDKVQSILDATRSSLDSIKRKNESSTATAGRISADSDEITGQIGEVVSSVQFHDITRQQVEHVKEALEQAGARLAGKLDSRETLTPEGTNGLEAAIADIHAVCELQKAQLIDSGEKFYRAAENIIGNLKGIAGNIMKIYMDAEGLAGAEGKVSSSFSAIEGNLSSAVSHFNEIRGGIFGLATAMGELTETVGEMSRFVEDIEEIGAEIELIAVNARIKAAHTGAEGAPLGVIAEAIQRLSADARVQKTAVSEELKRIMESVDLLRKNTGATDQMSQTDNLLDELALLLHELRDVNENALSLLSEVEQQGKRLASDIEDTAARITVHHEFMKKIERATADLGSIAATSKKLLSGNGKSLEPGMLRHLEKNYTMHSERHIHRSFAQSNGGPNQPLPLPVIKPAAKTDDGFGDNVELF